MSKKSKSQQTEVLREQLKEATENLRIRSKEFKERDRALLANYKDLRNRLLSERMKAERAVSDDREERRREIRGRYNATVAYAETIFLQAVQEAEKVQKAAIEAGKAVKENSFQRENSRYEEEVAPLIERQKKEERDADAEYIEASRRLRGEEMAVLTTLRDAIAAFSNGLMGGNT